MQNSGTEQDMDVNVPHFIHPPNFLLGKLEGRWQGVWLFHPCAESYSPLKSSKHILIETERLRSWAGPEFHPSLIIKGLEPPVRIRKQVLESRNLLSFLYIHSQILSSGFEPLCNSTSLEFINVQVGYFHFWFQTHNTGTRYKVLKKKLFPGYFCL